MKRAHRMPFGTSLTAHGVHFRLWAPAAQRVALQLVKDDGEESISMTSSVDGWFDSIVPHARPGSRYRYRIDDKLNVPDPASRCNPDDVHAPSQVIDPNAYVWKDSEWRGKPWETAVIYEIHVGAFTAEGTFRAVVERLDYLIALGVTAIELMPVADFPGQRNWGYDGVLQFAPDSSYGKPEDLKYLVDTAHQKGLMVFLDVVYNHFGPEGNYLHAYAPQFFTERHHTPWGAAINFDGEGSRVVRDFFIHNALYWLEEFHFDGLRFDAVHAIVDDTKPHILIELAEAVHAGPGQERHVHLMLENDHNTSRYLQRDAASRSRWYTAQWNDDIHHVAHVLATDEIDGYYADYADQPVKHFLRCLTQGFAYQGEKSPFRHGEIRGEPSGSLPLTAFISFMQNHDQVGNRAFGERLAMQADPTALRALTAAILLAPSPPLLFMGEEFGASQPFQFFCHFGADLADAVRDGRRREFAQFARFSDPARRESIPDPNDVATFERSKLDWAQITTSPHDAWLTFYKTLLGLRQQVIVPRLAKMQGGHAEGTMIGERGLCIRWRLGDDSVLTLHANLGNEASPGFARPIGEIVYATENLSSDNVMAPWSAAWYINKSSEV
ncbi:MAG: malto-oligosyltrehalose trehalohydrolase [Pseudomonadota bacterium]